MVVGSNNPFEVIFAITAVIIFVAGIVAVVASGLLVTNPDGSQTIFGQTYPQPPGVPQLQDMSNTGNRTPGVDWAFYEVHNITQWNTVNYNVFNPDKRVDLTAAFATNAGIVNGFQVSRNGIFFVVPYWAVQPVITLSGSHLDSNVISVQQILDNWNGSYSTFIVDPNNGQYGCFISFSPIAGSSDLTDSWNNHHGFTVALYGDAYQAPDWLQTVSNYLVFGFQLIAYFILYAVYIVLLLGVFGAFMDLNVAITSGAMALVIIICGGSLLMFIRGNSGNK